MKVPVHSHDRTMLASLGFADPDKRDRLHTLACRYLDLSKSRRIIAGILSSMSPTKERVTPKDIPAQFEAIITKGEGQYQTIVGFADLVLPFAWPDSRYVAELAIEVKIRPVDISEILRQIRLYHTYYGPALGWMVATAFRIPRSEVDMLYGAGFYHVVLGDQFRAWAESQATTDCDQSPGFEV